MDNLVKLLITAFVMLCVTVVSLCVFQRPGPYAE